MSKVLCILVNLLLIVPLFADELVVKTKYGFVKGSHKLSVHGRKYRAFSSIPYAKPPVGALRLKPPVPPVPWNGNLDVTATPPYCVQPLNFPNAIPVKGQEDCLYLGVFVPEMKAPAKLPVMLFIHGGGFATGGGADYPPDYLMDKNVVYVYTNYRLGALGFLGGLGKDLPGNFGLKDQSLALQWVHDNIEAFGGNPKDITLFGQSVGSASVSLHAFSPLSKGLYHKSILESATAYSIGALYSNENARAMTTSFAAVTGCLHKQNTAAQYLECFQALPVDEFLKAAAKLPGWYPSTVAGGVFLPCVEGADVPGAALPHAPSETTYVTKDIKYMAGINAGEGTFLVEYYRSALGQTNATIFEEFAANYKRLLTVIVALNLRSSFKDRAEMAELIKQFYFGSGDIPNNLDSAVALDKIFRDGVFMYSIIETLNQVQAFKVPTYLYLYSYKIDCKSGWGCYDAQYGVNHGDEQIMLYPVVQPPETYTFDKFTPREKNISETLVSYWTNFAIHGDPNGDKSVPLWTPYDMKTEHYLHITKDAYTMERHLFKAQYMFWKNLVDKFKLHLQ